MPLKAINPTWTKPSRGKVSLYGAAGVGKTWGAMGFPAVYYICTESGNQLPHYMERLEENNGVYFGPEQGACEPQEVLGQIRALGEGGHDHKTLVIDSVTKLMTTMITAEQERLGDKDGFGASKKPATKFMRQLLAGCDRLDMNVILIHHQKGQWMKGDQVGWESDGWEKTSYELNIELHITAKGSKRTATPTKSRELGFPLGKPFPWSYEAFAERFGKDRLEAEVKAVAYATPEQLETLNSLIAQLKKEGMVPGWLARLGVERFSDADSTRIAKLIEGLQEKVGK